MIIMLSAQVAQQLHWYRYCVWYQMFHWYQRQFGPRRPMMNELPVYMSRCFLCGHAPLGGSLQPIDPKGRSTRAYRIWSIISPHSHRSKYWTHFPQAKSLWNISTQKMSQFSYKHIWRKSTLFTTWLVHQLSLVIHKVWRPASIFTSVNMACCLLQGFRLFTLESDGVIFTL